MTAAEAGTLAPGGGRTSQLSLSDHFDSLGFIGAGAMASAIVRAVASKGLLAAEKCAATDVIAEKAQALARELGIRAEPDAARLAQTSANLVLAVKPQDMMNALAAIRGDVSADHLIISIAAGIPTAAIEGALPDGTRVVRVMPNTPAMVGEGAAGVAGGKHATPKDILAVCALFEALGMAAEVDESDLDAITALSGSGPAYVFKFIECMEEAGREMGLDPELAHRFTMQTFVGGIRLASESKESVAELRRRVTSPGGTTAAALEVFAQRGLDQTIKDALKAARDRSIELASQG